MRYSRHLMILIAFALTNNLWASDDWTLQDTNGTTHTLSGYHGKWVLVNFWATWCPNCMSETQELNRLRQSHRSDLVIIGIAEGYRNPQEVTNFMKDKRIDYPVVLGNEDTAGDFGGIIGVPTSFLFSPSGELIDHVEGPVTQAEIESRLR